MLLPSSLPLLCRASSCLRWWSCCCCSNNGEARDVVGDAGGAAAALYSGGEAAVYEVGDSIRWTVLNTPNYTAWAESKEFHVGDVLAVRRSSSTAYSFLAFCPGRDIPRPPSVAVLPRRLQILGSHDHNPIYFLLNEKGDKVKEQTGIVRTNCVDCLDRTNITQSMIGRKTLERQLKEIGIFGADDSISAYPFFYWNFKILQANHGYDISIQYSGTPALKGDFVRSKSISLLTTLGMVAGV